MKRETRELLPSYVKKIGWGVVALMLLLFVLHSLEVESFNFMTTYSAIFECITLVALFLIAFSKDKDEDERTMVLRGKAYTTSFLIGIGYFIAMKILYFLNSNSLQDTSIFEFMLMLFFWYFATFWILKHTN